MRYKLTELLNSSGYGALKLLACALPDSALAARVQSVLLAGALRPSSLQGWLRATAAAAHCYACWPRGEDKAQKGGRGSMRQHTGLI
jgi:hypothetical protein